MFNVVVMVKAKLHLLWLSALSWKLCILLYWLYSSLSPTIIHILEMMPRKHFTTPNKSVTILRWVIIYLLTACMSAKCARLYCLADKVVIDWALCDIRRLCDTRRLCDIRRLTVLVMTDTLKSLWTFVIQHQQLSCTQANKFHYWHQIHFSLFSTVQLCGYSLWKPSCPVCRGIRYVRGCVLTTVDDNPCWS